ncbi:MAG: hypothetical protein KAV87_02375 [Desulfobacteraceae bacterium]|nr:hypothetical protein [Desulfobacteraceae bacterium]
MALNETDIANIAIRDVGATEITDIDDDTGKVAATVRTYWDAVVDECLRAYKWTFAKKVVALAAEDEYVNVDGRYQYSYAKPADYIRMVRINVENTNFAIRGNSLLTDISPCIIEYVYRHNNAILWPSYFYMALAAHLASFLAIPLSKKGTKKVDWSEIYLFRLATAQDLDALEDDPKDQNDGLHAVSSEPWLTVREV